VQEAVMGYLKRFFRLEPQSVRLLSAHIITDEDYKYYISFSKYHPELQSTELVRLTLHYYARILFTLNQSEPQLSESALRLIKMMQRIINKGIYKDSNILRDAGIDRAAKMASSEPGDKPREITATLLFIDKKERQIKTDIPRNITAKHLIYSVMTLMHSILIYLDQEQIDNLNRSISNMNAAYNAGQSYSDKKNLVMIPTNAFTSAISFNSAL
jgi:hypothetical protein